MAGLKNETRQIGSYSYKVTALNALDGRKAFVRLVKLVGPAISAFGAGNSNDDLLKGLSTFASNLDEADFEFFCNKFSPVTDVSGGELGEQPRTLEKVFMTHFSANYFEMCEWLAFAFEVNFSSFFAGAAEAMKGLSKKAASFPAKSGTS